MYMYAARCSYIIKLRANTLDNYGFTSFNTHTHTHTHTQSKIAEVCKDLGKHISRMYMYIAMYTSHWIS